MTPHSSLIILGLEILVVWKKCGLNYCPKGGREGLFLSLQCIAIGLLASYKTAP